MSHNSWHASLVVFTWWRNFMRTKTNICSMQNFLWGNTDYLPLVTTVWTMRHMLNLGEGYVSEQATYTSKCPVFPNMCHKMWVVRDTRWLHWFHGMEIKGNKVIADRTQSQPHHDVYYEQQPAHHAWHCYVTVADFQTQQLGTSTEQRVWFNTNEHIKRVCLPALVCNGQHYCICAEGWLSASPMRYFGFD